MAKLQFAQNAVARVLTATRKWPHHTSFEAITWLPVRWRIIFVNDFIDVEKIQWQSTIIFARTHCSIFSYLSASVFKETSSNCPQNTNILLRSHFLMQPSMSTLNSPSSRIVKDSTQSRRRILRCLDFSIGESSPNLFLNMVNIYLVRFEARWILNERGFCCFIIFLIWKWILT